MDEPERFAHCVGRGRCGYCNPPVAAACPPTTVIGRGKDPLPIRRSAAPPGWGRRKYSFLSETASVLSSPRDLQLGISFSRGSKRCPFIRNRFGSMCGEQAQICPFHSTRESPLSLANDNVSIHSMRSKNCLCSFRQTRMSSILRSFRQTRMSSILFSFKQTIMFSILLSFRQTRKCVRL